MKKSILLLFVFCANGMMAQDSLKVALPEKPNPILFMEVYGGFGGGNNSGWVYGGSINYQIKRDLVTFRLGGFVGFDSTYAGTGPIIFFPVFVKTEKIVDYSLLYGKRWIGEGTSFSVSTGVSYMNWEHIEHTDDYYYDVSDNAFGVPFEVNVKWFKKEKKRFRAYYGLIPIGQKKVSFGRSVGFKLVGNISKTNYFGFGINWGFGWHKKY